MEPDKSKQSRRENLLRRNRRDPRYAGDSPLAIVARGGLPPEVDSEHRKERKMPETALERIIRDPTYKVDSPLAILIRQGMARKAESERPEEGKDSQEKSKESKEKSEDPREKGKQPMEEQPMPLLNRLGVESRELCDSHSAAQTSLRNPLSAFGSTLSLTDEERSNRSSIDEENLLHLCDDIRASLVDDHALNDRWEKIMAFLGAEVENERRGLSTVDFEIISNARLDKLLTDMVDPANFPEPMPSRFIDDREFANKLQWLWTTRHRAQFLTLEQDRYRKLLKTGGLSGLAFTNSENIQDLWRAKDPKPYPDMGEDIECKPGDWWLNIACLHRDGVVNTVVETPTIGSHEPFVLPLLTGVENYSPHNDSNKFKKVGAPFDMHPSLLSKTGRQVHVFRGHRLKSPLAPKAGIRYDGLYILDKYSQRLNTQTEMYQLILTLKRLPNQTPIMELLKIPRPSQMDDWHLYEKHEGEMLKQKRGDQAFMEYKEYKAQAKMERYQYNKLVWFKANIEGQKFSLLRNLPESPLETRDGASEEQSGVEKAKRQSYVPLKELGESSKSLEHLDSSE